MHYARIHSCRHNSLTTNFQWNVLSGRLHSLYPVSSAKRDSRRVIFGRTTGAYITHTYVYMYVYGNGESKYFTGPLRMSELNKYLHYKCMAVIFLCIEIRAWNLCHFSRTFASFICISRIFLRRKLSDRNPIVLKLLLKLLQFSPANT